MKIKAHFNRRLSTAIITAGVFVVSFALIAWAGSPGHRSGRATLHQDTIPSKTDQKSIGGKDFDKELRQLDEAKKQLQELKNKNWDKIQQDIEEAMKKIDLEKIRLQAEEAVRKVDFEKIGKEIEESLSKIDFSKIEHDIEEGLNEISKLDREKIKQEIQKARKEVDEQLQKKEWRKEMQEAKKINMKEIQQEMEEVKKEMAKIKDELKMEKLDLKETMTKASVEIEKAKEELKSYQEMIYKMEKDGLLNTEENYTIEYGEGELSINGKKQSDEIANRYKKYFSKEKMTIKKQNGKLSIDED